ncbi:MAG: radical SAM family heme chaperone HemW [Syntrophomonadaceae bacterium]|nr:radical SAM family heme chaperone HemW [Syntrophomonadaceae bacterium]MDD3023031.1 radical SAM family heme chaperone HemW [Syntrophomonadaceae bacterium]
MLNSHRGLYIHIPFCIKKCRYCDFYSEPLADSAYLESYTAALLIEIEQQAEKFSAAQISSIFIGGGTPSLLTVQQLAKIFSTIKKSFKLVDNIEISIEANPAALELSWLERIADIGINRLSIGVQSFADKELKILGRAHNCQDIMESIENLHSAGLTNFNIDLIYGIPGQSLNDWQNNLQRAVDCSPLHISAYLLQLGNDTPMAIDIEKGRLAMLDEDSEALLYYKALEFLQEKGLMHYEISNFCNRGFECLHNLNYWQAGEYIGIGAGAVSYTNCRRYINQVSWQEYIRNFRDKQNCVVEELEKMSAQEAIADAIILGLRLCRGINLHDYNIRFGTDIANEYADSILSGIEKGLLKMEKGQLSLTKQGYFLSNEVLCQFIT